MSDQVSVAPSRPAVVTIIAVLLFILSAMFVYPTIVFLVYLYRLPFSLATAVLTPLSIFPIVLQMIVGVNLLRLRPLARVGAIFTLFVSFGYGVIGHYLYIWWNRANAYYHGLPLDRVPSYDILILHGCISLFCLIAVSYLLTRPTIIAAFRK